MLNQIILVGRIVNHVKSEKDDHSIMTLAIPRSFKNVDGNYDNDIIECKLFNSISKNTLEYCQDNSIVGVKGRVQSKVVDDNRVIEIIAEKITFLQK